MTADERRTSVLAVAVEEFARGGLAGTSTEVIAKRAGISQPYLFRLYPTKKDLFLTAVRDTFARTVRRFEQAAGELGGQPALKAIGLSYQELLRDRTYLLMQLQAYASCTDPDIRAATRTGFHDLWRAVERLSGVPSEALRGFFAHGMLMNVAAAMDLPSLSEEWARLVCLAAPSAED
ncbi:TetR/AcrR family transcriptional regulator [Frankia sp. Cas4]|uniref:TetR/AcrR family transcriptional regulator n=1 Tax=Frankia sp. Cas4 TaxID=3073927 RepID=UPI002AD278E6|nr:TetR/AcrR family transcriptional regulator [Frankia sp. Cas4]